METQAAIASAKIGMKVGKKVLAFLALVGFGFVMLIAVLVGATNSNNGLLETGPQYTITGSVIPPASLQAVFVAAAAADGYSTLSASTQQSVHAIAKVTGASLPCTLPWQLLAAESYVESSYHTTSISSAGAEGIMQFEPTTFGTYEAILPVLNPSGGVMPPNPTDAPDAIYAADMLLCGDGATSGAWSVGDIRAVGQYNCGGTWITDPSACDYRGFTTTDYVNRVHAVFAKILTTDPLGSSSAGSGSSSSAGGGSSSSSNTPPTPVVNPLAGNLAQSAQEVVGENVSNDSEFIAGVCELASSGEALPPPTGESSLSNVVTSPAAGDFAVTPYGLGVVLSSGKVAVVEKSVIVAVSPGKGWTYGVDPAYE